MEGVGVKGVEDPHLYERDTIRSIVREEVVANECEWFLG